MAGCLAFRRNEYTEDAVTLPRCSLAELMVIVALAAVDCLAIRLRGSFSTVRFLIVGGLPMVNVLVISLLLILRRRIRREVPSRFLVGFAVTGWVVLGIFVAVCVQASEPLSRHLLYALTPFLNAFSFIPYSTADFVWRHGLAMCYLTAPQLAAALVAGGMNQRRLRT
jgi:hypothetical protein